MLQMRNPGNDVGFKGLRCGDGDEENGVYWREDEANQEEEKGPSERGTAGASRKEALQGLLPVDQNSQWAISAIYQL